MALVCESTADRWLSDVERYVQTRSADGAMFLGLQEFIKKLAAAAPAILLGWLPCLSDRLADWLPGMLHALGEAGEGGAIDPLIEQWIADGKHLSSIAWYLQSAERFRFDLLVAITEQALSLADDHTLGSVALAAARQSERHPNGLFDEVYLKAARALAGRGNFCWTGGMFNWKNLGLLKGLTAEQAGHLLASLVDMPSLGLQGEEMLALIAEPFPDAVIDSIGERFARERLSGDVHYQDLPHGLFHLREPLAAVPEKVVTAARAWFDAHPILAEYRGGRLIAELFPNLEHPLRHLLHSQIDAGTDGIAFVLSVLRAYEGQAFLHPLLRDIVDLLDPEDDLVTIVHIVIGSSGVLTGEYGPVEAQEKRKALVRDWATDDRLKVRDFAARFIRSAENALALERRRADQSVAMRKIDWAE